VAFVILLFIILYYSKTLIQEDRGFVSFLHFSFFISFKNNSIIINFNIVSRKIYQLEATDSILEEKHTIRNDKDLQSPTNSLIPTKKRRLTLPEKYPYKLFPSIILAGFPKTGTTSVAYLLASHPNVIFPGKKELNFLGVRAISESKYVELFPDCRVENCTNKITIDGSIALSVTQDGFDDCIHHFPDTKLVFVVRNPVEKAYSYFRMDYRNGKSKIKGVDSFEKVINTTLPQVEQFLIDFNLRRAETDPPVYFWDYLIARGINKDIVKYIPGGLYYYLMEPFLRSYPREKIHIVNNYKLETDPETEMKKLFEFAGLSLDAEVDWEKLALNRHPPEEDMKPVTREMLTNFFKKYNQMFEDQVGESFDLDKY